MKHNFANKVQYKIKKRFACREFLIGAALSIDKLIKERATLS